MLSPLKITAAFSLFVTSILVTLPALSATAEPAINLDPATTAEAITLTEDKPIQPEWSPTDQDIRILEIRIGQFVLEEIIAAYQYQDVILIPLGALSESIDLAIESRPDKSMAQGFIFNTARTFYLDTDRNEVTIAGVSQTYKPELVHTLLDDIYVDANLLSKWLKVQLSVNLFSSQLWITSDEPLPFQKRLEREKKIAQTLSRIRSRDVYYPRHYEPYSNISTPFVDQTFRTALSKQSNGSTDLSYNYTTYVTADLAKLESEWYLSGSDLDLIEDFRLTLGRNDPESKLLGPLKATEFSFGHVFEPRVNLITQPSTLQPGFFVSDFKKGRQLEYDRHTFYGDLQPGWEIEIYHNNSLIGYQSVAIEGQYRFEDIPLLYGSNHFRLISYGPQGQTSEENFHFELGDSLTKPGENYYRAAITEDEDGGSRILAQFDIGILKNLSASFNLTSIPLQLFNVREQHNYLQAGLRSYYEKYFFNVDLVKDTNGGSALEFGLQTSIDDIIIGFDQALLNSFFSEQFISTAAEISDRTSLRLNTSISTEFLPRIPIAFELLRERFANGNSLNQLINQLSFNVHGIAYNNQLTLQKSTNQSQLVFGAFQLSQYSAKYGVRGTINYTLDPKSEFTNATINYDLHDFHQHLLKLTLTHSLIQDVTELSASMNKPIDEYNLSYGAKINTNDAFSINVNFSIGIGRKPRSKQWITSSRAVAATGSVSARVFIDGDQDGVMGDDDYPLPDVGFTVNGSNKRERTNDDGTLFMTSLAANQGMDIAITQATLDDPLWTSVLDGVHIIPRAGKTIELEFPVFITGEIDGTVFIENQAFKSGAGNVTVEIVDSNDQVIATTVTAYDGFYIISNIPVGQYSIRIADKHLRTLKVSGKQTQDIDINIDSRYINGVNFTLKR